MVEHSTTNAQTYSNPEEDIQLYQQALAHLSHNELENAESILRLFTKKNPALAGPWANLGLVEFKRENLDNAEKLLTMALEKNSKLPQAHNLLGLVNQKKGNIHQAEAFYTEAIAQKDDYAIAHYNIALLYDIYLRDIQKALFHYKRYLEITNYTDQQTASWVEELKFSLKTNKL